MHIREIVPELDGRRVLYLLDNGRIAPLEFSAYSVGQATPRLGLTISGAGLAKTK